MKYRIDTEFFERQIKVQNITKDNIFHLCKFNKSLRDEITNDNPIDLMSIVKIARLLNVNLYHLIKI